MGMDEDESSGASNPHALAMQWIAAWNSRNLDAILSHYSDNVEVGTLGIVDCTAYQGPCTNRLTNKYVL